MRLKKAGFTLIEIIIVTSIVGLLAALGSYAINQAINKSRKKQAKTELELISSAVLQLAWDTGMWPSGESRAEGASTGIEVWDLSESGLFSNTNDVFSNWKGPYFQGSLEDPWKERYFFDADYQINGEIRVVVGSRGPNRSGNNVYDNDNIIVFLDD